MKKKFDGISVVIPYYKGESYIKKTLDSLLISLKYAEILFEILVVNDSPQEDINYLELNYLNVRIINNEYNSGIAESRNRGKKNCKYSYIYFIDQDDWVEKDFFSNALKYMEAEYDFILYNCNNYYEGSYKKNNNFLFSIYLKVLNAGLLIKYGNVFRTTGQVIVKRKLVSDFISTKSMGSDDFYLYIDLFYLKKKKNLKVKYIKSPLFIYRIHSNNYSNITNFYNSSLECFNKYKEINCDIKKYEKYLLKRYKGNLFLNLRSRIIHKTITL